ncbi:putative zinc-binding protein [bacterium]|nr:putative zinc-binding protein [bacterium]
MKRAVLPCNGLDKAVGVLALEIDLRLSETQAAEIICPVLLNNSPARYEKALADASLIVIDGCPTRCASKLANKLTLKVDDKVLVSEQVKSAGLEVGEPFQRGACCVGYSERRLRLLCSFGKGSIREGQGSRLAGLRGNCQSSRCDYRREQQLLQFEKWWRWR